MSDYYVCPSCGQLTDTKCTGEGDGIVECDHCGTEFDSFYADSADLGEDEE